MFNRYAHIVVAALNSSPKLYLFLVNGLPLTATFLLCLSILKGISQSSLLLDLFLLFVLVLFWPLPAAALSTYLRATARRFHS